jgi:Reverse transcriptase (RNA-dependent DNA polymerase)
VLFVSGSSFLRIAHSWALYRRVGWTTTIYKSFKFRANDPHVDVASLVSASEATSPFRAVCIICSFLFNIYLNRIFEKIKKQNPELIALLFVDDIVFLALWKTVKDIQNALTNAEEQAITWGLLNNVKFDVEKIEAILFTKKWKIRQNLLNYNIKIQSHNIKFNKEATRWLRIWLNADLSLKKHR